MAGDLKNGYLAGLFVFEEFVSDSPSWEDWSDSKGAGLHPPFVSAHSLFLMTADLFGYEASQDTELRDQARQKLHPYQYTLQRLVLPVHAEVIECVPLILNELTADEQKHLQFDLLLDMAVAQHFELVLLAMGDAHPRDLEILDRVQTGLKGFQYELVPKRD